MLCAHVDFDIAECIGVHTQRGQGAAEFFGGAPLLILLIISVVCFTASRSASCSAWRRERREIAFDDSHMKAGFCSLGALALSTHHVAQL